MKMLTLIVHADIKQVLADTLREYQQVAGFTFSHVEGHGAHEGCDASLSARDAVVGFVPHLRVEIVLENNDVAGVLDALRNSRSGLAGLGRYWITEVESQGQL